MELNLHAIATQCFVSGRAFAEGDRIVSYLVRLDPAAVGGETPGGIARHDLLESEDERYLKPMFVYCRWITVFKPRAVDDNPDRALKLTAENLFLTLAPPAGAQPAESEIVDTSALNTANAALNTPLLQFLALMLERKKLIKLRGLTEDRQRRIYEHMPSHQLYEVPDGILDDGFFLRIQEHLGVLVGAPKAKVSAEPQPAPVETE